MADDDDAQFEQMSESEPADVEYMFAQTARGVSIASQATEKLSDRMNFRKKPNPP